MWNVAKVASHFAKTHGTFPTAHPLKKRSFNPLYLDFFFVPEPFGEQKDPAPPPPSFKNTKSGGGLIFKRPYVCLGEKIVN